MRLTNQIRPLLIGLPILVSQAFVLAGPAVGWEWNTLRDADSSQGTGGKVRVVGGGAVAPSTSRWTDGQQVEQAYAQGVPRAGAVRQTAHTGPSRGGTLIGNTDAGPFPRANGGALASGKKPPTWHGYTLGMPTKLFGRGGNSGRPAIPNPVAKNYAGDAAAVARMRQGSASRTAGAGRSTAIPAPWTPANALPADRGSATQNLQTAVRSRAAAQSRPTAATRPTSAQQATTPASFSGPALAEPAEPTLAEPEAAEAAPVALEPKTPADQLILQVHEFAARAATEEDFSRIIETCRRARASQLSPQLGDYANQLAAWSLNRRGQVKAEAGRTMEALLDFDDAIRTDPKLWRALHNRGVLRAQTGQFEQAFDDFNLTIQFNPKFAKAFSNRAALFVVAGDLQPALDDYGHAIELDPNLAVAHRGRARVCHQLGRLDEALDHYDAAVQLAAKDAYAVASRADLLTDLGRYVDAAEGYDRAIELDPQSVGALRGSAWLLATCPDSSVRNARLAVERAEAAIRLEETEDAIGLDTLAAALASAGDFTAAMQTIRQAIQIAPANERDVYQDRLTLYQRAKPYRIAPVRGVAQASYESQ